MQAKGSPCFLLISAVLSITAQAQPVPDRYIVEFDSAPAVTDAVISTRARIVDERPQIAARRAQIQTEHGAQEAAIRAVGGAVLRRYDTVLNGMAVAIADQDAARLRSLPGVKGVFPDKRWHPVLDQAVLVHRITDAWTALPGGSSAAGAGTMIAIMDTGIDVSHPGFQGFNTPLPAGFPVTSSSAETANTNNKIIVSRDYIGTGGMDTVGHGTGNAMVAAGLTNTATIDCQNVVFSACSSSFTFGQNPITGVAPGAWLGNYKVCDASAGCLTSSFLAALGDIVNDAAALRAATGTSDTRVVANYSAGGPSIMSGDENGPEARAIHNALSAGILVVIAAGNDGLNYNGGQSPNTVGDPGLIADAITVGAVVNQRIFDYAVIAPGATPFEAALPDTSNDTASPDLYDPLKAPIVDVQQIDGNGFGCAALPPGSLTGKIVLIQRGSSTGSACLFDTKLNNAANAGALGAVIYNNAGNSIINISLTTATLPALFIGQGDGQTLKSLIASGPGMTVTLDFAGLTPFSLGTSDIVASYSAAGPTSSGSIKPDLTAVGGDDIQLDCSGLNYLNAQILTADSTANDPIHPYNVVAGTSLSAPFVAGSIAVLKSARPGLSAAQYRSLVVNTAPQFTSAVDGSLGTPAIVGSGKLDLLGGLQNNLTAAPSSLNFQTGGGQANSSKKVVFTNVGPTQDTFTVTVNSIDGAVKPSVDTPSFSLAPGASQTVNVTLSGSGLTPGAYDGYVVITGSQTAIATRLPYWFGVPGSSVVNISVLNQNDLFSGGQPGESDLFILVRYTDQAGLPISADPPSVSAVAARSRVINITPVGDIPGTYQINIQLGRVSYTYDEFDVSVGNVMTPVYVPVY